MFGAISMFCQGPSQGHFNPRLAALAKMSPSSGPEHIYAGEHKLSALVNH